MCPFAKTTKTIATLTTITTIKNNKYYNCYENTTISDPIREKVVETSLGTFIFKKSYLKNHKFKFDCQRCIRKDNVSLNPTYDPIKKSQKNSIWSGYKKTSNIIVTWKWFDNQTVLTICNGCYGRLLSIHNQGGTAVETLFENLPIIRITNINSK